MCYFDFVTGRGEGSNANNRGNIKSITCRKLWANFSSDKKVKGEGLCRENTSIFFKSFHSNLSDIFCSIVK